MNKRQKELAQLSLDAEKKVLNELEKEYSRALSDINKKVLLFDGMIEQLENAIETTTDDRQKEILISQRQSKVYQKQYQEALQGQINGILDKMHGDEYATIEEYLKNCYEDAYIGTLYDLQGQGIPLIMPIDQAAAVKAITTDSKISKSLYTSLGADVAKLKKTISSEITRGIAASRPYAEIARNLSSAAEIPQNRAKLITRTEGHRIQSASNYNACVDAKAKGADVVKQWSAALDARTRPSHRSLDGQIVEVDEPFSLGNKTAMFPGDFGDPAEDCNCRCRVNQRARWALDESELDRLKERAKYYKLDKTKDFEDYKKKYLKAVENERIIDAGKIADVSYISATYGDTHAKEVKTMLDNASPDVLKVWNKYQSKFKTSNSKYTGTKAFYSPSSDDVTLNISAASKGNSYQTPYQVLFHEYGHMLDYLAAREQGHNNYTAITEVFAGLDATGSPIFDKKGLGGLLGKTAKNELNKRIKEIKKNHGVKTKGEAADILIKEIKDNYSLLARSDVSDMLEGAGLGVAYPLGVGHGKTYWKNRDNGKEILAEIFSAEIASPDSLACIQKYFPETYKVFKNIMEVIK